MQGNYGGGYPQHNSYGYSGASSYGRPGSSGKSNAMMYAGGGFLAGAAVGVGGYYLYQRMKSAQCSGYSCCYGCDNACYDGARRNCDMQMDRQLYRDDLMADSGFIPNDEKPWPLKLRIYSVAGAGYPRASVCPPSDCTDADVETCNTTAEVPNDLYVTLTAMEPLADPDQAQVSSVSHPMDISYATMLPMLFFSLRT